MTPTPRNITITMGIVVGALVLIVVGAMIAGSQSSSSRQVDPFEPVGDLSQQAHDKGAYAVAEKLIQEPSEIGEICTNLLPDALRKGYDTAVQDGEDHVVIVKRNDNDVDRWIWMASCEHGAQAALDGHA